jgi:cysteinyl-tRNA synthetase
LIKEREKARKNKAWSRADEIRDHLASQGIVLEDGPRGTTWRVE